MYIKWVNSFGISCRYYRSISTNMESRPTAERDIECAADITVPTAVMEQTSCKRPSHAHHKVNPVFCASEWSSLALEGRRNGTTALITNKQTNKQTPWSLDRKLTIPPERQPLVADIYCQLLRIDLIMQRTAIHVHVSCPLPYTVFTVLLLGSNKDCIYRNEFYVWLGTFVFYGEIFVRMSNFYFRFV
jgi:hypothetical protein